MPQLPIEAVEGCARAARMFAGQCLVKTAMTGVQVAQAFATFGAEHAISQATGEQHEAEKLVAEKAELVARAWEAELARRIEHQPDEQAERAQGVGSYLWELHQRPERN